MARYASKIATIQNTKYLLVSEVKNLTTYILTFYEKRGVILGTAKCSSDEDKFHYEFMSLIRLNITSCNYSTILKQNVTVLNLVR